MPPCRLRSTEQELNERSDASQRGTLAFPQPAARTPDFVSKLRAGAFSHGFYENPESGSLSGWWGVLQKPEVIALGWLEALAHLSLMTFKSQSVSPTELTGTQVGREGMKKATPLIAAPILPAAQVLLSTVFLVFSCLCL